MKSFNFIILAISFIMGVSLLGCRIEVTPPLSPIETIRSNPALKEAAAIIDELYYGGLFEGEEPFTFFAPTNEAIQAYLQANGVSSLQEINRDQLIRDFNYWIINGRYTAAELETQLYTSIFPIADKNLQLLVEVGGSIVVNREATVIEADIEVGNSIIHLVDKAVAIQNFQQTIEAQPGLDTYQELFRLIDQDSFFTKTIIQNATGFTLFVPTDEAFLDLFDRLNVSSLAEIEPNDLGLIFFYNAADNLLSTGDLAQSDEIPSSVINRFIDVRTEDLAVILSDEFGREANIVKGNITHGNGYLHIIDKVLLVD